MASVWNQHEMVLKPILISKIAGRYLLFDIEVVTYLRRVHNICGVLIGGIPQVPQQNVFLGLPLELLPEEALVLVEKNVASIVDDESFHKGSFSTLTGLRKKQYLDSLREEGRKASRSATKTAEIRAEIGLAKQAAKRASKQQPKNKAETLDKRTHSLLSDRDDLDRPPSPVPSSHTSVSAVNHATLTVTSASTYLQPPSPIHFKREDPCVPLSYPLFAHLHDRDYFITPGLRFGCDYTVYPGDPLRFHSHFLAVGYAWDQEIPMIDLIGGGRLGTGVKKGFLIGGEDLTRQSASRDNVRTFCIEWGGM